MIKIKVQRYYSLMLIVMLFVGLLILFSGLVYLLFFSDIDFNAKSRSDLYELIGIVVFVGLPILFTMFFNKEKYVSEILIFDESIDIVYKIKGKEVERKQIFKTDIEKFTINTELELKSQGRTSYTLAKNTVNIKTKQEEIEFFFSSQNNLFGCAYQLILDLIKYSTTIPNFEYHLSGSNIYAIKDIEYFCQFGKRLPLKEKIKFSFNQSPLIGKILLAIVALTLVCYFGFSMFLFMPSGKLSNDEQNYINHYNKAEKLRIEGNYTEALEELSKAEEYSSTTAETYLEKAYNYKKLKQYDKGIIEAKEGLKYINSKSIYNKYHNFRFLGKKDIALYTVLGEMYEKTKDYKNMKDSYDYVINHCSYTYTDAYFYRGMAEYYLLEFNLALNDFLKHKEIIQNYIKDQQETQYKALYPTYDNSDLENVELWIQATKKYGKL